MLAILLDEAEADAFQRLVAGTKTLLGAPTALEARLVLETRLPGTAEAALRGFISQRDIVVVPFDAPMFEASIAAFARFGRGRGHRAKLNFGDCLSYAVAKTLSLPLLFKGDDFVHTDIVPAYIAAS